MPSVGYVGIMTEGMRFRPFTESDLSRLEEMFDDPEAIGVFNWGGFQDRSGWRKRFADNRLLDGERNALMVDLAGTSLGFVSWTRPLAGRSSCIEFGISLWPDARGKGYGTTAQLMLARYLFAHHDVNRIQAFTESGNIAEQRALEKAGFIREAVLKGLYFRDGEWRDEVLYRMLRSELPPA
jgi:RimJ/RimL family protein N-acetyltransferase